MTKTLINLYILTLASLYFVMSSIFGWAYTVQIVGILVLIETTIAYSDILIPKKYDGRMIVESTDAGGKLFSLQLSGDPEDLESKDLVSFKVIKEAI